MFNENTKQILKDLKKPTWNSPMGVSEWRRHGIQNGYWAYFEKDVKEKIKKELEKIPETNPAYESDMYDEGRQDLLKEIKQLI